MAVRRVLVGILIWLVIQPALAAEDPAQCKATMDEYVQRLELYVTSLQELGPLVADAQRKGDTVLAAQLAERLEGNRVNGVGDMLRRIEEEYVACGKSLFDADLIARVEAARPWGNAAAPALDVEAPPRLEIAGITPTFVPYETTDSGSCTGPYIDLAIKLVNRGGTFPRQVDLDIRRRTWPTSDEWAYVVIELRYKYDNGDEGADQAKVFSGDLPNGVIPAGGAVTVPMRVQVLDNRKHMTITGWFDGGSLAVAENDGMRGPPFSFEADIPIWDLYTVRTDTLSSLDTFGDGKSITTAVRASIINRGDPTPGPVRGYFTVRSATDGTTFASIDGQTAGPVGGGDTILAGKKVPAAIVPPIEVESQLMLLCPNGTPGQLADGNRADDARTLTEQ
jgi:hypothetical protein